MNVLVTGVCGMLGHDLVCELRRRGCDVTGCDLPEALKGIREGSALWGVPCCSLDITDGEQVEALISGLHPDAVVHCAAWTAVDAAEAEENREKVYAVNAAGTGNIARSCRRADCKLVYLSTDYVFDGRGETPWKPEDPTERPLNVYGRTKLAGEKAVRQNMEKFFIVRTAWVFGRNGKNFVKTMLQLGQKHDALRVVNDQIGTPTYTRDLAVLLADLLPTRAYGCYHATNEGGYLSWYDFACEIFRQAGMPVRVQPVTTEEYGCNRAVRPFNSRLDNTKLVQQGFAPLPDWRDALGRYLKEVGV